MGISYAPSGGLKRINIVPTAAGNVSASGNAFKGCQFTPSVSMSLRGLYYCGALVNAATYKGAVITVSGGTIATITSTTSITAGAADTTATFVTRLSFATPVALSAGVTYGIIVGRTDGLDTYVLPMPGPVATACATDPALPAVFGDSLTIAENDPVVGTAVTTTASTGRLFVGVSVEF